MRKIAFKTKVFDSNGNLIGHVYKCPDYGDWVAEPVEGSNIHGIKDKDTAVSRIYKNAEASK